MATVAYHGTLFAQGLGEEHNGCIGTTWSDSWDISLTCDCDWHGWIHPEGYDRSNRTTTTFPELVLSATRPVTLSLLYLRRTPSTAELMPEVITSHLAALPTLVELAIRYEKCQYPEDRPRLRDPPQTRIILPILTHFRFEGDDKYLEYFVSRIDAPLLNNINILFFGLRSPPCPTTLQAHQWCRKLRATEASIN